MKYKMIMVRSLCVGLLLMMILGGCSTHRNIDQMPYPEAEDNLFHVGLDFWSTGKLADLWMYSDNVVVGYYEDIAPTSENISRDLRDPSKPSQGDYYEALVYQFRVVAVLKGELEEETIPLGHFHGRKVDDVVYPFETFQQPDLNSYKVMFVTYNETMQFYDPVAMDFWLSTEHNLTDLADVDWTAMTFQAEHTRGQESQCAFDLFEDGEISVLEAESANMATEGIRTSCTGAELAAYAAQAAAE